MLVQISHYWCIMVSLKQNYVFFSYKLFIQQTNQMKKHEHTGTEVKKQNHSQL